MKRAMILLGSAYVAAIAVVVFVAACISTPQAVPTPATITVTNGHVISEEGSPAVFIVTTNHLPTPAGAPVQDVVVTTRVGAAPLVVGTHTNRTAISYAADYPPIPISTFTNMHFKLLAFCESTTDFVNWTVIGSVAYPTNGGTLTATVTNLTGKPEKFLRFGYAFVMPP
jgi:hypothetical protein